MPVHQLISTFVAGDASCQAAVNLALALRRLGHTGQLYAGEVAPPLRALVRPASELHPAADDLVLYHHGIASTLAGTLLHLPCKKGVVFHNITPARFYEPGPLRDALVSGRAQLAAMAPYVDLALGVSDFNARELRAAGYPNVHTVPLFVEAERFGPDRQDASLAARLANLGPCVLSVSRVVRHKRFDHVLSWHRELRRLRPDVHLLVVGGYAEGEASVRALLREAKRIGQVHFLGKVTHAELVAAYRASSLLISMSEHEGFGVPLVEAMACDVPVLGFAAGAVPETLGGHGVAFDEKHFALLAELARELLEDQALRERVLEGQKKRLDELSAAAAAPRLARALRTVLDAPRPRRRRAGRPRVAIVVQRYGEGVVGGAEAHARQVAQRLGPHAQVTVLTSCAADHLTWENEFPPGDESDGEVRVRRFASSAPRSMGPFNRLSRELFGKSLDRLDEERWIAAQGPLVPGLWTHLEERRGDYDAFVFFTYLYATTVWGLPLVADRALLVPTAHDEPPLAFDAYADVFELPRALLCNTPEELELIARRFPRHARAKVVGVGVDAPRTDAARFRKRHQVEGDYLFYVGRIEEGKGVGELLGHYRALRREGNDAPQLLLAGAASMRVEGEGVRHLGRVSDEDKFDGLAGALAAVVPSRYESLSLLALESFAAGTPVIGCGHSPVVAGQLARSGAGPTYTSAETFAQSVHRVRSERAALSRKATAFAKRHSWPRVVETYLEELEAITKERR